MLIRTFTIAVRVNTEVFAIGCLGWVMCNKSTAPRMCDVLVKEILIQIEREGDVTRQSSTERS